MSLSGDKLSLRFVKCTTSSLNGECVRNFAGSAFLRIFTALFIPLIHRANEFAGFEESGLCLKRSKHTKLSYKPQAH